MDLPYVSAETVAEVLTPAAAVQAIENALLGGLDPAADADRQIVGTEHGQILLMPSQTRSSVGVKLATVAPANPERGLPRIQAVYVLFDAATLTPRMLIDGSALTTLRTPAVSVAAIKPALLAKNTPLQLTVFGVGPQGLAHEATIREVVGGHRPIESVTYVSRGSADAPPGTAMVTADSSDADEAVRGADVIVCATTSAEPVFDSTATKHDVIVVAVGSHEPDRREVDASLVSRAQLVVEDPKAALRECGDIVMGFAGSDRTAADLISIRDVVTGVAPLSPDRAVLFKSAGMSWEDIVIAEAVAAGLNPRVR